MPAPDWKTLRELWDLDPGALRDVYVPDVVEHDQQAVLGAVSGRWPISYEVDGSPTPPPDAPLLRAALTLSGDIPEPPLRRSSERF